MPSGVVRDDRGEGPPASGAVTTERRGPAHDLAKVRWFNENLNASSDEQRVRALVLSAAMLAQHGDRDAVLTSVMLAWFAPRLHAE
jgi:hypothetical protein